MFSAPEGAACYTILYNLLNFPAGAVTVSTVTEEDEAQLRHYKGAHGDVWDKLFVEVCFPRVRSLRYFLSTIKYCKNIVCVESLSTTRRQCSHDYKEGTAQQVAG